MNEVAGSGACLVDPFDPSSIRSGIQKVIENEAYRSELVQRGYENAQRFQPAAVAAQYLALYEELRASA
jgi:glycosyltransferase involved in cell wall biosynthesis